MTKDLGSSASAAGTSDALSEAEGHLGRALAVIHRVLPRLDEPERATEVQAALQQAAHSIELARQTHRRGMGVANVASSVHTGLEPELVAVISAAVAAVLDRPYRLVSVQPFTTPPVPHLNVWALEGRTQIFQSHKIR